MSKSPKLCFIYKKEGIPCGSHSLGESTFFLPPTLLLTSWLVLILDPILPQFSQCSGSPRLLKGHIHDLTEAGSHQLWSQRPHLTPLLPATCLGFLICNWSWSCDLVQLCGWVGDVMDSTWYHVRFPDVWQGV